MAGPKASFKNGKKRSKTAPAALRFLGLGPGDIDPGEATYAGSRVAGASYVRIGQDRRQQRRLSRRQHRSAVAEGIKAAGLRAELTAGPELGDIEVDFQNPGFRQDEVDP